MNDVTPTQRRQDSLSTINFNRGSGFKMNEDVQANGGRHWSILEALAECPTQEGKQSAPE